MKTIKTLKLFINILYFALLAVFIGTILFYIALFFFSDLIPFHLQGHKMLFTVLHWKPLLVPITTAINFILFIISIYYLKKSTASFLKSDFYTEEIIQNLKKSGKIFVFIGISTILVMMVYTIHVQGILQNMIEINVFISLISILVAAIDLKSIFLIIIGLFFLLFSKSFENARAVQQENDLTI